MTIRQTIALMYGVAATAIAVCVLPVPSQAEADRSPRAIADAIRAADAALDDMLIANRVTIEEIAPNRTGHAEEDDLPAYLTAEPEIAWDMTGDLAWADSAPLRANASVLAPDGPAGLSWTQLILLGVLACTSLVLAFARSNRNA